MINAEGAAKAAEALVPVQVHGWSPTAYGMWGLLLLQLVALTGYLIRKGPDYIREWAGLKKQDADSDREDRAVETAERGAIEARLRSLEERTQRMGQAMSFMMNAAVTSTNALEAVAPGNAAIKQSRDLIAYAASALGNEDPFSRALSALANIPGVGE